MSTFMRLPNELLLNVFSACASVDCAVKLAYSNHKLYRIWSKNTEAILKEILRARLPAYHDALALAKAQTGSTSGSLQSLLPLLRQNADLAASAEASFKTYVASMRKNHYRHSLSTVAFPTPYYVLRIVVLSYFSPELRPKVHDRLCSSHLLLLTVELSRHLSGWIGIEEQERMRHGIPKDESLWTEEDEIDGDANNPEWDWADEFLIDEMKRRGYMPPLRDMLITDPSYRPGGRLNLLLKPEAATSQD